MGLKVSTISRLPVANDRDYFIYFLDYGWDEPLSRAMYANFDKMAEFAAEHRSLVLMGFNRQEFANEVLSWHSVNGEDASNLLPAIMVTDCDPRSLADTNDFPFHEIEHSEGRGWPEKFLLIPLKSICNSEIDVANVLQSIVDDIRSKTPIGRFSVQKVIDKKDKGLSEVLILKPSFMGVGVDLKTAWRAGREYLQRKKQQ